MKALLLRYATPLITGLFLVSLISGIALFFHIGNGLFNEMHEILSMVLVLPFILHIWRNWRPAISYFRHRPMIIALLVSAALAGGFIVMAQTQTGGGPPQFAIVDQLMQNPPANVAALFHETPDALVIRLKTAGFTAAAADVSLTDIASQSGKDSRDLMGILLPPAQ